LKGEFFLETGFLKTGKKKKKSMSGKARFPKTVNREMYEI